MTAKDNSCAVLNCEDGYTGFTAGDTTVRFRTSDSLKRYVKVRTWDHGYIVVDAEYEGFDSPVEEYIDLIPILDNLYINADSFLSPIKEVRIV